MHKSMMVVHPGDTPPCLRPGQPLCRGCPGWEFMLPAASQGGAWEGAVIHCTSTGLALRLKTGSKRAATG